MTSANASKQWGDFESTLRTYFREYGGTSAILASPFFRAALFMSLLLLPKWATGGAPALAISVVPGLLGFSIAAFTLSLGIGSDKFRILLAVDLGSGTSVMKEMANAFLHFMILQVAALLLAMLIGSSPVAFALSIVGVRWEQVPASIQVIVLLSRAVLGWLVSLLVLYSLVSTIPAMFHVYKASRTFRDFAQSQFDLEFPNAKRPAPSAESQADGSGLG